MKRFGLRSYLPLVLAVLTDLVAMHGLEPGSAGHEKAIASEAPCHDGCVHADDQADGGRGGHAEHADETCAAAPGTAGTPALPAPAVLPGHADTKAVLAHGITPAATACGRDRRH